MFCSKSQIDFWNGLSDEDRTRYLTKSGLILNNLSFRGTCKVDVDQPYEFPRYLSMTTETKAPVWKDYQDYQIAQAIRACKLGYNEDSSEDSEVYEVNNNIASEKSGTTQVTYYERSSDSDNYIAEQNGLDIQTFKILKDWLTGGY